MAPSGNTCDHTSLAPFAPILAIDGKDLVEYVSDISSRLQLRVALFKIIEIHSKPLTVYSPNFHSMRVPA